MQNSLISKNEVWLESKWWYRFLKIIYIGSYILAGLIVLTLVIQNLPQVSYSDVITGSWASVIETLIFGTLIVFLFFEIVKRIFFYVLIRRSVMHGIRINWKKIIPILGIVVVFGICVLFFYVQHQNQETLQKNKAEEAVRAQEQQKADAIEQQNLQERINTYDAAQQAEQEKKQAQAKSDAAAQQLQEQQQQANKAQIQKCIADAKLKYDTALKQSCLTLSQEVENQYNTCATGGSSAIEKQCRGYYPAIDSNCDLIQIVDGMGSPWESLAANTLLSRATDTRQQDFAACYQSQ